MRTTQLKAIIFWGQGDTFLPWGWRGIPPDLPNATMVCLDSGHFAVEDSLDQIAQGIKDFYKQVG